MIDSMEKLAESSFSASTVNIDNVLQLITEFIKLCFLMFVFLQEATQLTEDY